MRPNIFSLAFACALLFSACQDSNPLQPPAPPIKPPPVVSKLKSPENVSVYLITPSLSNLTWKYSDQNVDGFLISRGNSSIGWTEVITVWTSTREYHDPLPSKLVGVDGIYYVITAISSGVKSDTAMSNNLGTFKAYNAK